LFLLFPQCIPAKIQKDFMKTEIGWPLQIWYTLLQGHALHLHYSHFSKSTSIIYCWLKCFVLATLFNIGCKAIRFILWVIIPSCHVIVVLLFYISQVKSIASLLIEWISDWTANTCFLLYAERTIAIYDLFKSISRIGSFILILSNMDVTWFKYLNHSNMYQACYLGHGMYGTYLPLMNKY
jgi:hypothetical protein